MSSIPISKGQTTVLGLAWALVKLAQGDPVHQMYYGIMITTICVAYTIKDYLKHKNDNNNA